jgi:hypothetical protein
MIIFFRGISSKSSDGVQGDHLSSSSISSSNPRSREFTTSSYGMDRVTGEDDLWSFVPEPAEEEMARSIVSWMGRVRTFWMGAKRRNKRN